MSSAMTRLTLFVILQFTWVTRQPLPASPAPERAIAIQGVDHSTEEQGPTIQLESNWAGSGGFVVQI